MEYTRPKGLRVRSFTIGQQVVGLQRQLFLLREALIRTTIDFSYYPDLFRALRVLVIDGGAGRLGELAQLTGEAYDVQSRRLCILADYSSPVDEVASEAAVFFRDGLGALFLPNPYSRWFTLRGVRYHADTPAANVDFWDYLRADVIAIKPEFGAKVTRHMLIAEVCNTRDVAHAAREYPVFLEFAHAFGVTAPCFIEIGQDVAYETLTFGRQVIERCKEAYSGEIVRAVQEEIPIPVPQCRMCGIPLQMDELVCPHCSAQQLQGPRMFSPDEQISSLFHYGRLLEMERGTVGLRLESSVLTYAGIARYRLLDISDGKTRMRLERTGDMRLVWEVTRDLVSHTATWDLRETPAAQRISLFLAWNPERVSITSESNRGGLWEAGSDGTFRQIAGQ